MSGKGNRSADMLKKAAINGKPAHRNRGLRTSWRILMITLLCLFLLSAPAALAETAGGAEYTTGSDTTIDTADAEGSAGSDPAAAVSGDTGELGSIELILKYTDKSTNTRKSLTNGALSIYNVTDLRDWSRMTSAQLDEQNQTLAGDFLNNELKDAAPLSTQDIKSGKVKFENLPRGMYLICQSKLSDGEKKILPFLMSVPDKNGNMNISASPKPGIETEKTPDKPKTPGKTKLPQTGLVLWPVFMLVAGGLLLILAGTWLRRRDRIKRNSGTRGRN